MVLCAKKIREPYGNTRQEEYVLRRDATGSKGAIKVHNSVAIVSFLVKTEKKKRTVKKQLRLFPNQTFDTCWS